MKVYDEDIQVRKKGDGTFTIAVRLTDETLVVKTISKQAMIQLQHQIQTFLKES